VIFSGGAATSGSTPDLDAMNVLITGISSGIGRALCVQLIAIGHSVWGVARRGDELESLEHELHSDKFSYSVCDISRPEDVARTGRIMEEAHFTPDVVVLNAGIEQKESAPGILFRTSHEVFSVNYFGALQWVDLFIGAFITRGRGTFIAVSSLFALRPDIDSVAYCSSKAALSMAFRSLRLRYACLGVRFSIVYLGPVDTSISASYRNRGGVERRSASTVSPQAAAAFLGSVMDGKRLRYYFPQRSMLPVRMTGFLSDAVFQKITRLFRR
jgi:NAD(P)-dependent dehydrogenase (short-subunit alcohol dehydrogenase family)